MLSFAVLSACALVQLASGAAIPMWELLSKEEKMSYLYSMFANQVEEYCEFSEMRNCNQDLLKYGLKKLKDLPEDHLDTMDPYQRGAHSIIWDSMMEGHAMMASPKKPRSTTTAKPNSYDDPSFGQDFGYAGEASAKIESTYRVAPPKGFAFVSAPPQHRNVLSGNPQYKYPQSGQYQQQELTGKDAFEVITIAEIKPYTNSPLDGPMVVKVYPDGSPVQGHKVHVEDEDLKQYKLSQVRIPTL